MRLLVFPVRLIDTIVCFFDQFNGIKQMGFIFVNEDLKLEENEAKRENKIKITELLIEAFVVTCVVLASS